MDTLRDNARYLLILGIILLVVGCGAYIVVRTFDLLVNGLLGAGALLLLAYVALDPDAIRRAAGTRQARYGSTALASTVLFAGVALLIYYIAFSNNDWRTDLTETSEFTLLNETQTLLEQVDEPVRIIGYFNQNSGGLRESAVTAFDKLRAESDLISYEFRDPAAVPAEVAEFELSEGNTLVFVRGEGDARVFSTIQVGGFVTDNDVHNGLLQIINPLDTKVYFLTGHGELSIGDTSEIGLSNIAGFIENQGIELEELDLFRVGAVPADASVLVIAGQQAPLTEGEVTAIIDYVEAGGALFWARDVVDPSDPLSPYNDGLRDYMAANWGVSINPDLIIDIQQAQAGQSLEITFLVSDFGTSPIIDNDLREVGMVLTSARSLTVEPPAGVTATELARTSQTAWGETDLNGLATGIVEPNENEDNFGPVALAAQAENIATGARVVVVGDIEFATNALAAQRANFLLFSNAINWLAGDVESIALTPRETVDRQLFLPAGQLFGLGFAMVCLAPGLVLLLGLAVFFMRRSRR